VKKRWWIGFFTVLVTVFSATALPEALPGCSGMAAWGKERYLVSHDWKAGQPGPRLGLVKTSPDLSYQALECDWSSQGDAANDLESVAPVEGMQGHFLACESGYFQGKYGRLYWIQVEEGSPPRARVLAHYALPANLNQEIEGLATLRLDAERWLIFLGGRGGKSEEPGHLFWGVLDRATKTVSWPAEGVRGHEIHLPRRLGPFARTLSDMYVDEERRLWICSFSSPGKNGPNRSLIFQAGTLDKNVKEPFHRTVEAQPVWWVDGVKVEGLSPCSWPGYGPAYVTDDDALGGIWRAVPASPSLSY